MTSSIVTASHAPAVDTYEPVAQKPESELISLRRPRQMGCGNVPRDLTAAEPVGHRGALPCRQASVVDFQMTI
jgi:hypothetical protein